MCPSESFEMCLSDCWTSESTGDKKNKKTHHFDCVRVVVIWHADLDGGSFAAPFFLPQNLLRFTLEAAHAFTDEYA